MALVRVGNGVCQSESNLNRKCLIKKIIKYNGDWTNEVNSKEYKNNN